MFKRSTYAPDHTSSARLMPTWPVKTHHMRARLSRLQSPTLAWGRSWSLSQTLNIGWRSLVQVHVVLVVHEALA